MKKISMEDAREWAIKDNKIKEFEIFEKSHKLSINLDVLVSGEATIVAALALLICLSRVILQDDRLNADQLCRLLKGIVDKGRTENEHS